MYATDSAALNAMPRGRLNFADMGLLPSANPGDVATPATVVTAVEDRSIFRMILFEESAYRELQDAGRENNVSKQGDFEIMYQPPAKHHQELTIKTASDPITTTPLGAVNLAAAPMPSLNPLKPVVPARVVKTLTT